jgi:hypothetical protein
MLIPVQNFIFHSEPSEESIVENVRRILSRCSSQPIILAREGTNLSLADTLEILTKATATLRKGYPVGC